MKKILFICCIMSFSNLLQAQNFIEQNWVFASTVSLSDEADFKLLMYVGDRFDKCKLLRFDEDKTIDLRFPKVEYTIEYEYKTKTNVLKMNLGDRDQDDFLNFLRDYEHKVYLEKESLIWEFLKAPDDKGDKNAKGMFKVIFKKK